MYTGPDSEPYMALHPPWPVFVKELRRSGYDAQAKVIEDSLRRVGYRL